MLRIQRILFCVVFIPACLFMACEDDDKNETVGFEVTTGTATENDDTQTVTINLGKKVTSATTITLGLYGTAALDGDFGFSSGPASISFTRPTESALSFTVPSGASSVTIPFQIINDQQVEPAEDILYFQIHSVSDADVQSSITQDLYACVIDDNDMPPGSDLQVDLSWHLGNGVSINDADFDLYLAYNVVLDGNDEVISADVSDQIYSEHDTGFETIALDDAMEDGEYYILIHYTTGSLNAQLELILSQGNSYSRARGSVTGDLTGTDIYYGPVAKSGNSFTRSGGPAVTPGWKTKKLR